MKPILETVRTLCYEQRYSEIYHLGLHSIDQGFILEYLKTHTKNIRIQERKKVYASDRAETSFDDLDLFGDGILGSGFLGDGWGNGIYLSFGGPGTAGLDGNGHGDGYMESRGCSYHYEGCPFGEPFPWVIIEKWSL